MADLQGLELYQAFQRQQEQGQMVAQASPPPAVPETLSAASAVDQAAQRNGKISQLAKALYTREPGQELPKEIDGAIKGLSQTEFGDLEHACRALKQQDIIAINNAVEDRRYGKGTASTDAVVNPRARAMVMQVQMGTTSVPADYDLSKGIARNAQTLVSQEFEAIKGGLRQMRGEARERDAAQRNQQWRQSQPVPGSVTPGDSAKANLSLSDDGQVILKMHGQEWRNNPNDPEGPVPVSQPTEPADVQAKHVQEIQQVIKDICSHKPVQHSAAEEPEPVQMVQFCRGVAKLSP